MEQLEWSGSKEGMMLDITGKAVQAEDRSNGRG